MPVVSAACDLRLSPPTAMTAVIKLISSEFSSFLKADMPGCLRRIIQISQHYALVQRLDLALHAPLCLRTYCE